MKTAGCYQNVIRFLIRLVHGWYSNGWDSLSRKIYRIIYGLPWITIWLVTSEVINQRFYERRSHDWKSSANNLTSDQKIVIHDNECIILFLTRYHMSWTHNSDKQSFVAKDCLSDLKLWRTTVDMWRQVNAKHWHCDVIFVDCSCTCKLAQMLSWLVNNNREYWSLTTRYSRLSV